MDAARYTVRFRRRGTPPPALIVEDGAGRAFVYWGGALQVQLAGPAAAERLARLTGRGRRWERVPRVAGYALAGLAALTAPTAAGAS